jgi:hypothetical protein
MRHGHRLRKMLLATAGALLFAALALGVFLSQTPYGYFDLTTMMPGHDSEDTVLFANGSVTMKSCCGDMALGSYSRASNGSWRWHYKHGPDNRLPQMDFLLEPGILSVKVISTNWVESYILKRKLTKPRQHEIAEP